MYIYKETDLLKEIMVDELWNNQTNRKQNLTIVTKNKQNNSKSNQRSNKNSSANIYIIVFNLYVKFTLQKVYQLLHKKYMFSKYTVHESNIKTGSNKTKGNKQAQCVHVMITIRTKTLK